MNDATIKRLNQINRDFYRITADSFDQKRLHPWPGWERLLPYLKTPLSVLDVGCGNGRFGEFLAQRLGTGLTYHGLDSSPALLDRARTALAHMNAHLEVRDVIERPPDTGQFNLVALFGVAHHVPGSRQRCAFLRHLVDRITPGGLLVFTAWRFFDYQRFRDRIVPWPDDIEVEPHDYLLAWREGPRAVRYCHYIDDTEHAALVAATGLTEIMTFRADGFGGAVNRYSLLRRDAP